MDNRLEERIGRNEATYRSVNEAIERGHAHRERSADDRVGFVCECASLGCNQLVELTVGEYEAVRANPRRFLIVPGHEVPETEDVVERRDGYVVVEKVSAGAAVAEETDPRTAG